MRCGRVPGGRPARLRGAVLRVVRVVPDVARMRGLDESLARQRGGPFSLRDVVKDRIAFGRRDIGDDRQASLPAERDLVTLPLEVALVGERELVPWRGL